MSKETVSVNVPLPKPVHEKAKAASKAAGLSMKDYLIKLIEGNADPFKNDGENDLISLLSQPRSTQRFGDETIIEEMHRRIVSMHLITAERLAEEKGEDAANQSLARIHDLTVEIINQRKT